MLECRNTRRMFSGMTVKKPVFWHEVRFETLTKVGDDVIVCLQSLPIIKLAPLPSPLSEGVVDPNPLEQVGWRVDDNGEIHTYYINTEGYDYCRYAFEFPSYYIL